jgi:hypothetical protein
MGLDKGCLGRASLVFVASIPIHAPCSPPFGSAAEIALHERGEHLTDEVTHEGRARFLRALLHLISQQITGATCLAVQLDLDLQRRSNSCLH